MFRGLWLNGRKLLRRRPLKLRAARDGRRVRLSVDWLEDRAVPSNVANVLVNDPTLDPPFSAGGGFTQSETTTLVIPQFGGPSIILVGYNDSGSANVDPGAFTGYSRSIDGGVTFTDMGTILPVGTNDDAGDPSLAFDAFSGRVYYATLENLGFLTNMQVYPSDDNGATFQPPSNGTPGTTFLQDKEWITVDNFFGVGQGNVYLAERDFDVGNGIFFYKSTDQGVTFGPTNGTLIASGATGNVQGPQVAVAPDHSVYVAYYDDATGPAQQLRIRRSTDQGDNFGASVKIIDLNTTGSPNGNLGLPFRTSPFPSFVINPINGDLYIGYADVSASGDADVFFTMSSDNGATWSAPQRLNNDTGTAAQWQPSLAISPDGQHLFASWYDRRLDPSDSLIDVFGVVADVNTSTHAVSFNPNFRITDQAFDANFGNDFFVNPSYMGDYDQTGADSNFFYHSWADNRLGTPDVRLARIPVTGPRGPTVFTKAPEGTIAAPANAITLTFSEPMNQTSFSLSDVLSFTGPYAAPFDNIANNVTGFTWVNSTTLRINYLTQFAKGTYTMVIGPNITSLATGLQLDENLNGVAGEAVADDVIVKYTYDPGKGYTTAPTANAGGPYTVNEGATVTLNGSATDLNDPPGALVYQWDLDGDGIFGETGAAATSGNEVGPNPIFRATSVDGPSTFIVRFRAINTDGLVSTVQTAQINVINVPPTVSISGPTTVFENTPVTFTANISDVPADLPPASIVWTVTKNGAAFTGFTGQGTASITFNDTDAPAANDTFVVSVSATDKDGGTGTAPSRTLTVRNANPTATFTNDGPKPQVSNFTFTFGNQNDASPQDVAAGFTYSYDFNNNGNFTDPGDIQNTASPTATRFYPDFGTFTVRGRITDKDGGFTDYTTTVVVTRVGNGGIITTPGFATGADAGGGPHVRLFNLDGTERVGLFAYNEAFTGGVRVATGDIDGDQIEDIITVPGAGGGPHVRVFSGADGHLIREFMAFSGTYTGGAYVASADVNHDFYDDIVVGLGAGVGPLVTVFSGRDGSIMKQFFAYDVRFGGGVRVAAGDMDGDGKADIITAPGAGGGPHIRVFSGVDLHQIAGFFAFTPTFTGGVTVAVGDTNGDGKRDFIVGEGARPGVNSRVRVFSGLDLSVLWDYVVYPAYQGGLRVAVEDLNGDGKADIIIGSGSGHGDDILCLNGSNLYQVLHFYAYDPSFMGGVFVG